MTYSLHKHPSLGLCVFAVKLLVDCHSIARLYNDYQIWLLYCKMSTTDLEQLQKLPPEYLAEDIGRPLLALSIALIPLLTIFFVLFLTSRILLHTTKKVEAWLLMPLGYLSCLASCVCGICE